MSDNKPNRRVLMTKQIIKDSLIEILENKSIQKITVTEICNHADINRSTFYAYYSDPYDLMSSIRSDIIKATVDLLEDHPSLPPRRRLELLLNKHLDFISSHIKELMVFSSDVGEDFSLPAETMEIILMPYLDHLLEQNPDKENPEFFRIFSIFGSIGIIKNWIRHQNNVAISSLSKMIIKLIDDLAASR